MSKVLVIGAGPAGLAAAITIARAGLSVAVVEQRETIGGAIYRQPVAAAASVAQPPSVKARWRRLADDFATCGVAVRHGSVFLGIDGDGLVVVENRRTGLVEHCAAQAVIIATGAVEKVLPRPGWQMAGVSTVGGLQVMMKETGRAPEGRILLAGSGPLLLAVAAQMARLGNPPVAVVEAGDPLRHKLEGVKLAAYPALLIEALFYLKQVWLGRIPWLRGTAVAAIERQPEGLVATLRDRRGVERRIAIDRIGLHDGIRPNDFGLPEPSSFKAKAPFIVRAGDCREALGAVAAEADGRRAGQEVIRLLRRGQAPSPTPPQKGEGLNPRKCFAPEDKGDAGASCALPPCGGDGGSQKGTLSGIEGRAIDRQLRAQALLSKLFAPLQGHSLLAGLSDETVLCRCENRTLADLKTLCARPDPLSGREVKHNGRFAMGACQGRFCADNTARLMAELRPDSPKPSPSDLTGRRWPLRPISIGALVRASEDETEQE